MRLTPSPHCKPPATTVPSPGPAKNAQHHTHTPTTDEEDTQPQTAPSQTRAGLLPPLQPPSSTAPGAHPTFSTHPGSLPTPPLWPLCRRQPLSSRVPSLPSPPHTSRLPRCCGVSDLLGHIGSATCSPEPRLPTRGPEASLGSFGAQSSGHPCSAQANPGQRQASSHPCPPLPCSPLRPCSLRSSSTHQAHGSVTL